MRDSLFRKFARLLGGHSNQGRSARHRPGARPLTFQSLLLKIVFLPWKLPPAHFIAIARHCVVDRGL
jgi:hypothetical protein